MFVFNLNNNFNTHTFTHSLTRTHARAHTHTHTHARTQRERERGCRLTDTQTGEGAVRQTDIEIEEERRQEEKQTERETLYIVSFRGLSFGKLVVFPESRRFRAANHPSNLTQSEVTMRIAFCTLEWPPCLSDTVEYSSVTRYRRLVEILLKVSKASKNLPFASSAFNCFGMCAGWKRLTHKRLCPKHSQARKKGDIQCGPNSVNCLRLERKATFSADQTPSTLSGQNERSHSVRTKLRQLSQARKEGDVQCGPNSLNSLRLERKETFSAEQTPSTFSG